MKSEGEKIVTLIRTMDTYDEVERTAKLNSSFYMVKRSFMIICSSEQLHFLLSCAVILHQILRKLVTLIELLLPLLGNFLLVVYWNFAAKINLLKL